MPTTPPEGYAMAVFQGSVWIIGGRDVNFASVSSIFIYTPLNDTWTYGPSLVTSRYSGGAAVLGNFVYVFGGFYNNFYATGQNAVLLKSIEQCNLISCTTLGTTLVSPLSSMGIGVINSIIYIAGGGSIDVVHNFPTTLVCSFTLAQGVDCSLSRLSYSRRYPASTVSGGLLYVAGGQTQTTFQFLSSVEVYTPSRDSWQVLSPSLQIPRIYASMFAYGGLLYVVGGQSSGYTPISSIESFNISQPNTPWLQVSPSLDSPRYLFGVAVL